MNERKIDFVTIHDQCLHEAEKAFLTGKKAQYSLEECLRSAISMYLTRKCDLRWGLDSSELPVELLYPDREDRYIAKSERMRAVTIISESFAQLPVQDNFKWSEFTLWLSYVQYEIEGP